MNDLDKPKRQSPVGVAVIFFKNLRSAINIFISVILVQFGLQFSILGLGLKELAGVIAVLFLIISYLQYRRFYFYVEGNQFIIEKGLLSRDKITVPFDRIQTVNINQNLVQRVLRVVGLKIDTAGSAQKELEISALEKNYARNLQEFLIEKKEQTQPANDQEESIRDEESLRTDGPSGKKSPLVHLNLRQLLRVGISENHLRTGLVLFAVINGYLWQYEEFLLKPFEPMLQEQANYLLTRWLIILPLAALGLLVIAILLSVLQTILRYYNLYFFVDNKGAQVVSGLLKRSEYQIPINKIQYLKWKGNPLRKLAGIITLVIKQASSEEVGDRQSVRVPGCRPEDLDVVLDVFYQERRQSNYYLFKSHPLLFTQLGIWLGLVPALALSILAFAGLQFSFFGLIYLPVASFFIYKYYQSVGLAINRDTLLLKKGWVYPGHQIVKFYKLQSVSWSQSIFQKRRGLASIHFYTAAGDLSMPHIPLGEAYQVYNYCLYKIETDKRGWM
ncbi:MAG: PH domain-containing protein [Owenweeksia sp.]|nr:PH domain-containing protein [Owenweeksia sp.]